ncbi:MAG: hypothetical protein BWZ10_00601 [candidate division BRC1 bacterium ADurb.BinA364]|nr:MAG: hypothetical protein BWZ10_00601 [candidate division BRC1 bacterium ADurb.BinA364]
MARRIPTSLRCISGCRPDWPGRLGPASRWLFSWGRRSVLPCSSRRYSAWRAPPGLRRRPRRAPPLSRFARLISLDCRIMRGWIFSLPPALRCPGRRPCAGCKANAPAAGRRRRGCWPLWPSWPRARWARRFRRLERWALWAGRGAGDGCGPGIAPRRRWPSRCRSAVGRRRFGRRRAARTI